MWQFYSLLTRDDLWKSLMTEAEDTTVKYLDLSWHPTFISDHSGLRFEITGLLISGTSKNGDENPNFGAVFPTENTEIAR